MQVKFTLSVGMQGRREETIEIPDADVEGLSADELETYLGEQWQAWIWNYIDGGAEVVN